MYSIQPRSLLAIVGLRALTLTASCSQGSAHRELEGVGAVGLALEVSPGGSVTNATYTISGPNGFESAGTVSVGDSADVPVTVSHLPLGAGYEMDVTATASDGVTTCDGTATFDVTDSVSSTVVVHLVCAVPSGDIQVTGTVNVCPVVDSLGASPDEVVVGGIISLTSSAHDSDNGPGPLTYSWTANGAPLKQHVPNLNFACSSVGSVALKVTASDGDPDPSCADSLTINLRCAE